MALNRVEILDGSNADRGTTIKINDQVLINVTSAPHEGRTAALSPGVPLDAVVGRQNVTTE